SQRNILEGFGIIRRPGQWVLLLPSGPGQPNSDEEKEEQQEACNQSFLGPERRSGNRWLRFGKDRRRRGFSSRRVPSRHATGDGLKEGPGGILIGSAVTFFHGCPGQLSQLASLRERRELRRQVGWLRVASFRFFRQQLFQDGHDAFRNIGTD